MPGEATSSRHDLRIDLGYQIVLPELGPLHPMIEYLSELGYANRGMNGLESLTFSDVHGWVQLTEPELDTWALSMLVRLSRVYAYQANISRDEKCPEPYTVGNEGVDEAVRAAETDRKLRSVFRGR